MDCFEQDIVQPKFFLLVGGCLKMSYHYKFLYTVILILVIVVVNIFYYVFFVLYIKQWYYDYSLLLAYDAAFVLCVAGRNELRTLDKLLLGFAMFVFWIILCLSLFTHQSMKSICSVVTSSLTGY